MIMPAATTPSKAVRIEKTLKIEAPIQVAYEALLEQLGPACEFYEDQDSEGGRQTVSIERFREADECDSGHCFCYLI